jgi:hypothetical protein
MTPTPKLRFFERLVPMPEHGGYLKTVRILQQWWEPEYNIIDMVVDKKIGEWRDVSVEQEQL